MSDVNGAFSQSATGGAIPEDYAEFERYRQGGSTQQETAEEEKPTEGTDGGDAGEEPESADEKKPESSEDTPENGEEKPKKKTGWQRKIEKQERENEELRNRLAAVEGKLADPAKDSPTQADETPKNFSGKPEPKAEDFDTYEKYTKALARWEFAEIRAEEAFNENQRSAKQARETAVKSFQDRAKEAAKKYDDFEEVIESDLEISSAVHACMIESEHGPEIAYHLAKNPAEAERLNKLSPLAAAREIGKLETKFATAAAAPKPKPSSQAPDPITPVSSRAASPKKLGDADLDYEAHERLANKRYSRR